MNRPKLGQAIRITGTLLKTKEKQRNSTLGWRYTKTRWIRETITPVNGIYIGWRTVCDCDFDAHDSGYDYDETIENKNHQVVWLVVSDEHEKPFYVCPEDIEIEE